MGGNISGTGEIITGGSGVLTLNGTNTQSGVTSTVNSNVVTTSLLINTGATDVLGSAASAGTGVIALSQGTLIAGAAR